MAHPQNYLEKNSQNTKKCIFEEFLVFFEFFPGNFGGGPFWLLFSNFRGPGDLGLSHWRPESQYYIHIFRNFCKRGCRAGSCGTSHASCD